MVNYECTRCGYKTEQKARMRLHIHKKIPCSPIKSDINVLEHEDAILEIDESKKYLHNKIRKLEIENEAFKIEIKNLKNIISTTTIHSTDNIPNPKHFRTPHNKKIKKIPIAEEVSEDIKETINNTEVTTFTNNSILDEKINKIFNDEEKRMFSMSFRSYLKNDPNLDFVIDLDSVWRWIGYDNKGNAKRALLKSERFIENVHYTTQFFDSQSGEAKNATENNTREEERRGGHNKEIIIMSINTFKKFCMMAGTSQADKLHDYYIKLEQCVHEVRIEETNNFKMQLKDKDIQKEKNLIKNFDKKPVVYLATVEKDIISFGYTNDIKRRLKEHKKMYGKEFVLEYCFESLYNRELESGIKKSTDLYSLINDQLRPKIFTKEYNGDNQTELIQLDNDFTLEKLYKVVCKIKDSIDNIEIIKNLNVRNNELKNIIKELVD